MPDHKGIDFLVLSASIGFGEHRLTAGHFDVSVNPLNVILSDRRRYVLLSANFDHTKSSTRCG